MVSHIAIMGLGQMGHPIARNLAAKRDDRSQTITALDADPARLAGLATVGIDATTDRQRVAGAKVLFLCLPDGDVVEAVLFGEDGLAARLAPGRSWSISAPSPTARPSRSAAPWRSPEHDSWMRRSPGRRPARGRNAHRDVAVAMRRRFSR